MSGRRRRRWLMPLIIALALGVIIETVLLCLVIASEKQPEINAPADVIIVLGARVMPDGGLSTTLYYRVNAALDAYNAGLGEYIIACGARGDDEPASEADTIAAYLIGRGVPPDVIIKDLNSYNTYENLINAKALMEERGLSTAIITTSNYHVQRALWLCESLGIDARGIGAQASNYPFLRWMMRLRETVAWAKYFTLDRWR
jgi:uncharacterized SAM-binding protein YcdF (DUF218 family)